MAEAADDGNAISLLLNLTKEVSGVLREHESELPETVSRVERQVKIIASWLARLDGDRAAELPPELQEVLADIRGIVEGARNQLLDWARKNDSRPSWAKWVGPGKHLIMTFAPAALLSVVMMPGGPIFLLMAVLLIGGLFFLRPALFQTLQEAWAVDSSLQNFREVEGDLKDQAKQLRHFATLRLQIKKERKYDVSKVIEDPAVLQWWCRHFGSQQSSVPTDRVIQALLHDHPLYEKSRKETQVAMSAVMKDLVDANKDGDISPQELVQFLQSFGPIDQCVDKTINSVLDLSNAPPTRYRWFCWRKLDRRTVEETCPLQGVDAT
jgi:hypothetical protein